VANRIPKEFFQLKYCYRIFVLKKGQREQHCMIFSQLIILKSQRTTGLNSSFIENK